MVHGLDKFKAYFSSFEKEYVLIGGTACDILFTEMGTTFRATKDLDIVLIIESMNPSFGQALWKFLNDGGYRHKEKNSENSQFYRFSDPQDATFPKMIELFSRHPGNLIVKNQHGLTPIHVDENITSLSAILLDDAYYSALLSGRKTYDGISVVTIETIILFKIKAWLDMKLRIENGEEIDSRDIKKHKNDVFRLLANVVPSIRIPVAPIIERDIIHFIEKVAQEKPDQKNLGIKNTSPDELLKILTQIFTIR